MSIRITDLDKFSLEHVWRPYQSGCPCPSDRRFERAPVGLDETVAYLLAGGRWSGMVLGRIGQINFSFPSYVRHALVDVVLGRAVSPAAVPWLVIDAVARGGRPVLLRFGQDLTTWGVYIDDDADSRPWKFCEMTQGGLPFINSARDDQYGPSHYAAIPARGS